MKMPSVPSYRGYEKFWMALILALSTLIELLLVAWLSKRGLVPEPTAQDIMATIEEIRLGLLIAAGVFLTANSPSTDDLHAYVAGMIEKERQRRPRQPAPDRAPPTKAEEEGKEEEEPARAILKPRAPPPPIEEAPPIKPAQVRPAPRQEPHNERTDE